MPPDGLSFPNRCARRSALKPGNFWKSVLAMTGLKSKSLQHPWTSRREARCGRRAGGGTPVTDSRSCSRDIGARTPLKAADTRLVVAELVTCDRRALAVYERYGIRSRILP